MTSISIIIKKNSSFDYLVSTLIDSGQHLPKNYTNEIDK